MDYCKPSNELPTTDMNIENTYQNKNDILIDTNNQKMIYHSNIYWLALIFFIVWTIACIGMTFIFIVNAQYTGIFLALFFFLFGLMIVNCIPLYDKIIFDPLEQLITIKSYRYFFCCNKTIKLNIGHIQQVIINQSRNDGGAFDVIFVLLDGKESKVMNKQRKDKDSIIKVLEFLNIILPVNVIFINNLPLFEESYSFFDNKIT